MNLFSFFFFNIIRFSIMCLKYLNCYSNQNDLILIIHDRFVIKDIDQVHNVYWHFKKKANFQWSVFRPSRLRRGQTQTISYPPPSLWGCWHRPSTSFAGCWSRRPSEPENKFTRYSRSRLMWSLWARPKVITLTEW